jgi:alpha-galactosidase
LTKSEMQLVQSIFPFTNLEQIPVSFEYDGQMFKGIPASCETEVTRRTISANIQQTIITAFLEDGIKIVVEHLQYSDFPVTEWVAFFTNTAKERSKTISKLRIIDEVLPQTNARLQYSNGDNMNPSGYEVFEQSIGEEAIALTPHDGTSCNGASPYMKLLYDGFGVCIGIGWPGKWSSSMQAVPDGVAISIGQDRMHMYLNSGETIRTPRVNFLGFLGDEEHGRNLWRRWYLKHILPKEHGNPLPPKLCLHDWRPDGMEFTEATADKQLLALNQYMDRGMKPDIWWFDAGWYRCDRFWPYTGTWEHDRERFPQGLAPIGQRCEELDIQFLLWFEPERVHAGTKLDTEHSDWLLYPGNEQDVNRVLNYANPEALQWVIEHVDSLIKEYRVHIYRQDFNFDPLPFWVKYEGDDRIGAIENLHIQGYLTFWDEILRRNPGLWLDSCASGGRRNDLETMRRAVPLHYTDVGYGHHPIKQKQHRYMFEWIPYFRAHTMNWDNDEGTYEPAGNKPIDDYAYHTAMAPSLTSMILFDEADDERFALGKRMLVIWRRAATMMLESDYYPLTETRKSEEDYYAMQFHNPDKKQGFFQVVRNTRAADDLFIVYPKAVADSGVYIFENMETGEERRLSGAEWSNGFHVAIPKRSGQLWFYRQVRGE